MSTIRIPEAIWKRVHYHLFSTDGEHFAFLRARWTYSGGEPVFLVQDAILIPDDQVDLAGDGYQVSIDAIVAAVNQALRANEALIEVHNHIGACPRFSLTDQDGFEEFVGYVLESLSNRPYAATVWSDGTVYGEYFIPDGQRGRVTSITITGERLRQLVSRDDDNAAVAEAFDRQLPWFAEAGQRQIGRLRVGIVGLGGTGSQVAQNLAYLGVRDFLLIDNDQADVTNMNRLVTATAADLDTSKVVLARRLIRSVAPEASVEVIAGALQSTEGLDALRAVDVVFGCVDNDGARLILNELVLAYDIPYFDVAVGIEVDDDQRVVEAGGRVAIVIPGGPCLACMHEIDADEARFFLNSPEQQAFQIARGYVQGLDVSAPAVVSLNTATVATAVNEFAVFVAGHRTLNVYTELDVLGIGRPVVGQWVTPRVIEKKTGCVQCAVTGRGDQAGIDRYASS